ncbi:TonB-dependent receptor [Altererythrobacter sp. BO-6]|uniref:TonB-dependent receptor n=1 Tax=Altererythrobacter sp. BO-6 TaxID=2604537 RepID=UPI0013E136B2|nr:TonB-dependent receptor plug domain-containing protein [Altererythrobacter sp. BO-6]QIG54715.1 TonB-dependent receptor [Altererythrobacter sp. BO-6]
MNKRFVLLAGATAIVAATPAWAQDSNDTVVDGPVVDATEMSLEEPDKVSSSDYAAGDILVTARRREESLQRTPVSVGVLTSDTLAERAIVSESDIQVALPGVTVRASQNSNNLNYSIRGQSLDVFSNIRPGVLPYFNEVPIAGGIGGSSAFYDLASIQVLKGPQGTLFGRNATGGAVLLTTAKPNSDFGGYVLGRLGNYDLRYIEGAINLPIADTIQLRFAGVHHERDGFQRNVHPFCASPRPLFPIPSDPVVGPVTPPPAKGCRVGDVDRTGARATLAIQPTDGIENTLVVDYLKSGGSSTSAVLYSLDPTGAIPLIALTDVTPSGAPIFEAIISGFVEGAGGPPNAGAGTAALYRSLTPHLPDGGLAEFLPIQQERGPYTIDLDGPQDYDAENWLVSNVTTIDVGGGAQIKNVFGYIDTTSVIFNDVDAVPFGIDNNGFFPTNAAGEPYGRIDKFKAISNELQILGEGFNGQLDYVAGIFFSDEEFTAITGSDFFDFPIIRTIQINAAVTSNKTYAGFAQGTLDLSEISGVEGLSFTAGARYTDEKVNIRYLPRDLSFSDPPALQATYDPDQTRKFGSWSWTLGLQYQIDPDTLIYAATRRSTRHGGFNYFQKPVPGFGEDGGNAFRTEKVTDVELGLKKQGYIGIPYRFNLALYQSWIDNAQRVAYTLRGGAPVAITVNVPGAEVRGFEFDADLSPADWLKLGGQVNYTDAKFTDGLVSVGGSAPVLFGNYPDTPDWSGSVFADVKFPLTDTLDFSFRSDVYHQTQVSTAAKGPRDPITTLPSYTLVNFRVGIENDAAGWSIAGVLRNAFKELYYVGGVPLGQLFQVNTAVPGEPRTFMVEARYKF